MRTNYKVFVVAVSVCAILLALPLILSAQGTGSTELSNEEIIQAMTEAISAGEIDEALSYFTEDAYFVGYWLGETEAAIGHDEIRAMFEELAAGDFRIESEVIDTFGEGSVLLTDTHTSGAGMPPAVQPLHIYDVYLVKDGKIAVYFYYLSEESAAGFMELMASMEGIEAPIIAAEIHGTWLWGGGGFWFQFRSDGTFRASQTLSDLNSDAPEDIGTYLVEENVLYLTSSETSRFCPELAATYALSWADDGALQLTLQEDACEIREAPSASPQRFTWDADAP